jgi:hypothetical protein
MDIIHRQQRRSSKLLSLLLVVVVITTLLVDVTVVAQQPEKQKIDLMDHSVSRNQIIENHKRRREQLKKLLDDTKEKVSSHESGRTLFESDEEYQTMKKRVGLYEKKVRNVIYGRNKLACILSTLFFSYRLLTHIFFPLDQLFLTS